MAVTDPFSTGNLLLVAGVVTLIVVGAAIIDYMRREARGLNQKPDDLLTDIQKAYIRGEMSDEEYQRIEQSLRGKSTPTRVRNPPPGELSASHAGAPSAEPGDPLAPFAVALANGQISREEFDRIQGILAVTKPTEAASPEASTDVNPESADASEPTH